MKMSWVGTVVLGISLVSLAWPSNASEVNLRKSSAEQLKTICQKAGGSFSQSANAYSCGTDCSGGPGTDCVVFCPEDAKHCTAQVGGALRPKTPEQALAPRSKRKK